MTFGIENLGPDVIRYAYAEGFAKPNRFQVAFLPPTGKINVSNLDFSTSTIDKMSSGRLLIGCQRAQWPSLGFMTSEFKTKGPPTQLPYEQVFEEVNLSFLSDRFHYNHSIFKEWMELIYDPVTKQIEFYENYTADLEIFQLDITGILVNRVMLQNAYPKTVSEMDLAFDNNDELQTFDVSFVYDNIVHGFEGLASDVGESLGF